MPKQALAALSALLTFASTLAVVAQPAAAHSQTVQRCAYDPFTNTSQCWDENVAHAHACPAGTTGSYPNCYPVPPDNKIDTDDEEAKKRAEEARKKAEQERKRKEAEEAERKRKEAEQERKRKEAEQAERKRKEAEEAERKREEAEEARKKAEAERRRKEAEEAERKRREAEEAERKREEAERKEAENESDDPCGDYNADVVDALSKAGHTGTYSPPANPGDCAGPSTAELVAQFKNVGDAVARNIREAFEKAMQAQADAAEGEVQASAALREALQEILRNEYVQEVGSTVGCGALVAALIKSKGKVTKVSGWAAVLGANGACAAAVLYVQNLLDEAARVEVGLGRTGIRQDADTDQDGDDDSTDNPDPSDEENLHDAEEQAIKDAEAERDAALKAMQENPTYENRKKFHDADKRHGCLTGRLKLACR